MRMTKDAIELLRVAYNSPWLDKEEVQDMPKEIECDVLFDPPAAEGVIVNVVIPPGAVLAIVLNERANLQEAPAMCQHRFRMGQNWRYWRPRSDNHSQQGKPRTDQSRVNPMDG
jgi:hypothetical protein